MLVIRLARGGRSKYPTYRIVAAESARAATGKFVEILGHYNPHTKELVIKKEETVARLRHGAQPSNTVVKLLQREKIELPAWVALKTKTSKPKKEPEPATETPKPEAAEADVKAETTDDSTTEPAKTTTETATEESPEPTNEKTDESEKADEAAADDSASKDEPRVAEAATENAAETEDKAPSPDATETTETTENAAEAAEATSAAGVETADDKPATK